MKLKKKEDQSMDTLVLLRKGNKIPMEGVTETKCGAETEGKAIQRLPHLGIHPIYSYQTQTAISGSCQQALVGIHNSVWAWGLYMGWIPSWSSQRKN